jgi:hypothetical protein
VNVCIVCRRNVPPDDLALADARRWCVCLACYGAAEGKTTRLSGRLARELKALHIESSAPWTTAIHSLDAAPEAPREITVAGEAAPAEGVAASAARFTITRPVGEVRYTALRRLKQPGAIVLASYAALLLIWAALQAGGQAGVVWLAAGCTLLLIGGALLLARFAVRAFRRHDGYLGTLLSAAAATWLAAEALLWLQQAHVLSTSLATAELVQLMLIGAAAAASTQLVAFRDRARPPAAQQDRRAPAMLNRVSGDQPPRRRPR